MGGHSIYHLMGCLQILQMKYYDLNFEYVELGIEGPEGNPQIINKKKNEIVRLLQKFKHKPIGHTATTG